MKNKKKTFYIVMISLLTFLSACTIKNEVENKSYSKISQEEALEMMGKDDNHIIVDVRTKEEYEMSHISGAINIPNETIGNSKPDLLFDFNQIILVYCRSGRRSEEASLKLFNMGYTNVFDFGGINTWKGELVKDNQ